MTHLFRPADPVVAPTPPVGTWQQAQRWWNALRSLARTAGPLIRRQSQRGLCMVLLLLGLAVQVVLTATLFYLVDLSISLMELWAELARKHLELTL